MPMTPQKYKNKIFKEKKNIIILTRTFVPV